MKKLVITGATSMLGLALTKCAINLGMEVLCIVRKTSKNLDTLLKLNNLKIEFCDLSNYSNLNIEGKFDAFFHLAWDKTHFSLRDDVYGHERNIRYTLDAVHLAKKLNCSVFIGAGSQAEYGIASCLLRSDTPVNPENGYGIAKYAAGKLSRILCSQESIRHVWVRILSVFGPQMEEHTVIMYVLKELLMNRSPKLTKCEQEWDFLYSEDAAAALIALADNGINGKVYPLGSGKCRKLFEYIESIRNIVAPGKVIHFGEKQYYPHQPMYLCADISELTADTGWKPNISFESGIWKMFTPPPQIVNSCEYIRQAA
ncbi:MAG: NAD(P)-dependent oxidoreductase [Endomicrobium sp.]|jgi:nucleoside-diphosphate-sugar epimerase|nr:NAD(P)-dependent oxidoreductase [Endomicrobium sp.]